MVHPAKGSHLHSLSFRAGVYLPSTRTGVRLLGPCFKTGHPRSFRRHPRKNAFLNRRWLYLAARYNTPKSHLRTTLFKPQQLMPTRN
jgi:hypothetical protein